MRSVVTMTPINSINKIAAGESGSFGKVACAMAIATPGCRIGAAIANTVRSLGLGPPKLCPTAIPSTASATNATIAPLPTSKATAG